MKTKIKLYVDWSRYTDYLLLAITILTMLKYGHVWIGFAGIVVSVIKDSLFKRKLKKIILIDFRNMLEERIKSSDWTFVLPSPSAISRWLDNYAYTVQKWTTSRKAWESLKDARDITLKTVYAPCLAYSPKGISLYDIYYYDSIRPIQADPHESNTAKDSWQTSALLELLPVDDLIEHWQGATPVINGKSLSCLLKRNKAAGDFKSFCDAILDNAKPLIATFEVFDLLMKEYSQEGPTKFPQKFLAYLLKNKEDFLNLHYPRDREKMINMRSKVFNWYMSQEMQSFDFYKYWPKFTEEEMESLLSKFEGEHVRDEIFVSQHNWEHVSTQRLQKERVVLSITSGKRDEITEELLKRIPKE